MKLTQGKFAGIVGCSQQNISKLIKKGILIQGEDNKLDLDFSLEQLAAHGLLDEDKKLIRARKSVQKKVEVPNHESLPFESEIKYDSLGDLTAEEKESFDKEQLQKFQDEKKQQLAALDEEYDNFNSDDKSFNYTKAKAQREHFMAQIAELDFLIKSEKYIEIEVVERTFFEATRKVRDMLLNIPSKMSVRILGKKDPKEIEDILMDEIRFILGNLSK